MVKNGLGIVLEQLDAANDPMVDQLVVVTGTGMDSSSVKVGYYVREKNAEASEAALAESFWKEEFCTEGYCGHDGMSGAKREGDRRTPLGLALIHISAVRDGFVAGNRKLSPQTAAFSEFHNIYTPLINS